MENNKDHIIPYQTLILVVTGLIVLTLISVSVTTIHLGALTVFIALLIAAVKSSFVLWIFMHLKFEGRLFRLGVTGVILLITSVIIITMLDYLFR